MHVKATLLQSLRQIIREKFPSKTQAEISKEVERIRNGLIEGHMWKKIIQRMYEKPDQKKMKQRFREIIQTRNEPRPRSKSPGS